MGLLYIWFETYLFSKLLLCDCLFDSSLQKSFICLCYRVRNLWCLHVIEARIRVWIHLIVFKTYFTSSKDFEQKSESNKEGLQLDELIHARLCTWINNSFRCFEHGLIS